MTELSGGGLGVAVVATPVRSWARPVRDWIVPFAASLLISAAIVGGMTLNSSAITLAAVGAAFVAAVLSPTTGLLLIAVTAPLRPPLVIPSPGFNAALAAATALGCVYRLPIERPVIRLGPPLLLMLGFLVYVFAQQLPDLAAGYSGDVGHKVGYLFGQIATLGVVAIVAGYILRDKAPWPFFVAGLIGALAAAALSAATLDGPGTGALANITGISDATARPVGPFGDPNYFGLFEATAIAASAGLAVITPSRRLRILLLAVAGVLSLTLLISLSRGAVVALAAGVLVLAFTRSRRAGLTMAGVTLLLALVAYPLFVQWRVVADTGGVSAQAYASLSESDSARLAAALAGPEMFVTSPVFGIGFGQYAFQSARFVGFSIESHDEYMNILAEEGLVGVLLWVPFLVSIALALRRRPHAARIIGFAVFATYLVGSAFLEPPNSIQTSAFAVIAIVAALVADWRLTPAEAEHAARVPQPGTVRSPA